MEGGPTFDTEEVIITQTGLTLSFDFITQFDGSDLGASYADIFLATNPAAPDSYDYGISLGFQGGNRDSDGACTLLGVTRPPRTSGVQEQAISMAAGIFPRATIATIPPPPS